jgi:hypothetical protein
MTAVVKAWSTRRVRAYNLEPGDVLSCFDTKRMREVKLTVSWVQDKGAEVWVGFRKRLFGWKLARARLIRVRRLLKR